MAFVEFENVFKTYQSGEIKVHAVKDSSFKINEGELVIVVGPSGAGKTTLLNLLGGMDNPTKGKITLDKERIDRYSNRDLIKFRREDIGFVFQFYNLVQNLTALENVELASQISKDPLDARVTLEQVGLDHRLNNFPSQMSGGEQQRVSIARALAKNPKLLLCDEPTGALDEKTGRQILQLLQDTSKKEKKTVIIITHNPAFEAIGDRVIRINDGEIVANEVNDNPILASEIKWYYEFI